MYNKMKFIGFLASLILAFTSTAYAGGITFGAKTGPMMVDDSSVDSDPTNAGVAVGYEQGIVLGDIGVEGEFTTTMKEGSLDNNDDLSIDTVGVYVTYRSPGFLYLKARGGFVSWDADYGSGSDDDTVSSMGLGVGLSLALIKVELEFTQIDEDIDFVSIGVQF